jgi:dehydrogenase/reductase SDR family member 12
VAVIIERLEVPSGPSAAFDYVADFTTTRHWDPSIVAAGRLDGGGIGLGSRFRVRLKLGPTTVPLDYVITTYDRPHHVVLTTVGRFHRGQDDVRFSATDAGSRVDWHATFELRGPAGLLDPVLGAGFRRTAAASVAGLEAALIELGDG